MKCVARERPSTTPAYVFSEPTAAAVDDLAAALTAAHVARVGAALLPTVLLAPPTAGTAGHAAGVEAPSAPLEGAVAPASVALAAALVASQATRAGTTPFPMVLFVPPTVSAAGHTAGVGASFTPPVAAASPPPPVGTSVTVPAPLLGAGVGASFTPPVADAASLPPAGTSTAVPAPLTSGVPFFCGLDLPPEDVPLDTAAFLRGTLPVPVASRGPRPQAPPVAMFVVAAAPFASSSTPPLLPSQPPTWSGGGF
jgi:hypothetical protein